MQICKYQVSNKTKKNYEIIEHFEKTKKERISVALICSSTGEKFKPLVITKTRKPCCFSNKYHM